MGDDIGVAMEAVTRRGPQRVTFWYLGLGVLVTIALIASTCSVLNRDDDTPGVAADWFTPLWEDSAATYGEACTAGVCVADLVALPLRRPIEAVVDLEMPETLGALSVERLWTGERGGLFGPGWESLWDIELVGDRLTGPLPAAPITEPGPNEKVDLADGSRVHLDDDGLVERICVDGTRCVDIERSSSSLRLHAGDGSPTVTLKLQSGRVVEASTESGRSATFGYTDGRLTTVEDEGRTITYGYDSGGRLVSIHDGDERTFTYDEVWSRAPPTGTAWSGRSAAMTVSCRSKPAMHTLVPTASPMVSWSRWTIRSSGRSCTAPSRAGW